MAALLELSCGDAPAAWVRLGFAVEDGDVVRIGSVAVRPDGGGGGLRGWTLSGDGGPSEVAGIPTLRARASDPDDTPPVAAHPNGAFALDHVVLLTDDRDGTAAALVAGGGDERRRAGPPAVPVAMAFVRLGPVVVEVAESGGLPRL